MHPIEKKLRDARDHVANAILRHGGSINLEGSTMILAALDVALAEASPKLEEERDVDFPDPAID